MPIDATLNQKPRTQQKNNTGNYFSPVGHISRYNSDNQGHDDS